MEVKFPFQKENEKEMGIIEEETSDEGNSSNNDKNSDTKNKVKRKNKKLEEAKSPVKGAEKLSHTTKTGRGGALRGSYHRTSRKP